MYKFQRCKHRIYAIKRKNLDRMRWPIYRKSVPTEQQQVKGLSKHKINQCTCTYMHVHMCSTYALHFGFSFNLYGTQCKDQQKEEETKGKCIDIRDS